jgi:enamine deaminase RidA (YjgF/YER057c/UK114 family)
MLTRTAVRISKMENDMSSDIVRHETSRSMKETWAREFSEAIEIPAGAKYIVLSGVGALPSNFDAKPHTVAHFGDTRAQTKSVLDQIAETLGSKGYTLGDVVVVQAIFVGDPANNGKPDYEGFSSVYLDYFGSKTQPNLPTRTRSQVVGLVEPGWLVEITVTAAKMA